MDKKLTLIGMVAVGAVVLLLAPLFYGLFKVPVDLLRAWAVVATLALPAAFGLGWLSGRGIAKAALEGLDTGVDRVAKAAANVADIRDRSFTKTVQHSKPVVNMALLSGQLPEVEHQRLLVGEDTVDL